LGRKIGWLVHWVGGGLVYFGRARNLGVADLVQPSAPNLVHPKNLALALNYGRR